MEIALAPLAMTGKIDATEYPHASTRLPCLTGSSRVLPTVAPYHADRPAPYAGQNSRSRTAESSQRDRNPRECDGPPSERLNWRGSAALLTPAVQDGRGNTVTSLKEIERLPGLPSLERPQQRNCGPGASVEIPANGLVDAIGSAPGGRVDVNVMTVDLNTPNQMPGNYTVALPNGQPRVMQSYGAAIVDISAGGNRFNLRPGTNAKLTIPVDRTQLETGAPLPPTTPLLGYDEGRGVWRDVGVMTLQNVGGVPVYEAVVRHFSAYNSDLIKVNQSCLAVQNTNMPATYNIEATIPQTGGAAPVKRLFTAVTGGNAEIALLNLPSNTNIVLVPIRTSGTNPNLPMGVFVVNTGAPQNPAWPTVPGGFANEPVGPPYYHETTGGTPDGACSTKVVLQDLGLKFYPDPNAGAFLHGLDFAAVNLTETDVAFPADANQTLRDAVEAASADYRAQIDPRGLRPSLSCYKIVNRMPLRAGESCPQHAGTGFTPQPVLTETTAAYANTVDLGFGREMHCVRDGAKVACYVSNYEFAGLLQPGSLRHYRRRQGAGCGAGAAWYAAAGCDGRDGVHADRGQHAERHANHVHSGSDAAREVLRLQRGGKSGRQGEPRRAWRASSAAALHGVP